MGNNALRQALVDARRTEADLASACGVDLQTVSRWLTKEGRVPHARHRYAVCRLLEVDESMLWPETVRGAVKTGPDREVVSVYPSHSAMPPAVWQRLVSDATRELVLCGTSPHWLWWYVPDLTARLREKAGAGCRVRVVIGEPSSPITQADEEATGAPLTLSARIEQTRHLLEPLADVVEVRQTSLGFGRSVYRGDNTAVADWWLHGQAGTDFPVMHLHRHQDGGLFDQIAVRHVEALWEDAQPL